MTFFANAGIAWPNLGYETRIAGADALEAASRLWKLFGVLERGETEWPDQSEIARCAEGFENAASSYAKVAEALEMKEVKGLTPAEQDLAALQTHERYFDDPFYERLIRSPRIPIARLYLELSHRIAILADAVRAAFEPHREPVDLRMQVFQMMRQWELAGILGRVIAILNNRPPTL